MAIYRPTRRRWPAVAVSAAVGLLAGAGVGWVIRGGGTADPVEAIAAMDASLSAAAGTLEVVEVEYRESVVDGEVVRPPEYAGSRDLLTRSRERYLEVREALAAVDPRLAEEADRLYRELARLVEARAPAEDVSARVRSLSALLEGALGG